MNFAKRHCFVISPFGPPFDANYEEVLQPAIRGAGLEPLRADEINQPGVIIHQIWRGINDAAVCLADVTGRNANVMYEIGIAQALGKPVVPIVQDVADLPFDLQALRFLVYDTQLPSWSSNLRTKLTGMLMNAVQKRSESIVFPAPPAAGIRKGLETLIDESNQPMFLADHQRTVKRCNQALAEIVGGARSDFENKPFVEALLISETERVPAHLREEWLKQQHERQKLYDENKFPNTHAETFFDNTDFPAEHPWRGKYCIRVHAVRLPPNEEGAGYFVIWDPAKVQAFPDEIP